MRLDLVDKKLLYELDKDCRQSVSSLAKRLRVHRNVALYRIRKLENEGMIRGYFTEINTVALGYNSFRVFLKLSQSTKDKESRLIDHIRSDKNIIWFFKVLGKWDLDFVYSTKDVLEFNRFFNGLMMRFNSIIKENATSLLTQIYHYPKDYLVKRRREVGADKFFVPLEKKDFDDEDLKILHTLSDKADMNLIDLAKKTGLSVNTLKRRIQEMKKKRIILGFRPFIDTAKLGYSYYKYHVNLRNYTKQDHMRFLGFLQSKPFVIYVDQYINGEDFEIEMHLKTEKEFLAFSDEMKEKFGNILHDRFVIRFYDELVFRTFPVK